MIRHILVACSVAAVISTAAFAQSAKPQQRQGQQQQSQAAPQQQQQQEQQISSTPFDNWVKRCANPDASEKAVKTCEIRSHLVIQDKDSDKQVLAAIIVVARATNSKAMQAIVQVPTSARLNVMPKVYGADSSKPLIELPFFACQPQLCSAIVNLSDAQIASMKKISDKISVAYDNQAGQTIKIEGQAKGLAAALDSLIKEK